MDKKLFFILALALILPMISAMDWDNVKSYDPATKQITLYNYNIIGKLFDIKLAEYRLEKNTLYCASDCYAEGTANLYSQEELFSKVETKTLYGANIPVKEIKIYIQDTKSHDINIDDYKEVCSTLGNSSRYCYPNKTGSHKETITENYWKEYKGELLQGTYRWRIEGKKSVYQSVDWVGTAYGKALSEWAWWLNYDHRRNVTGLDLIKPLPLNSTFNVNIGGTESWAYGIGTTNTAMYYGNNNNFTLSNGTDTYWSMTTFPNISGRGTLPSNVTFFAPLDDDSNTTTNATNFAGMNGTLVGGYRGAEGKIHQAYSFDGNDVILFPDTAFSGDNGTWTVWLKPEWNGTGLPTAKGGIIFAGDSLASLSIRKVKTTTKWVIIAGSSIYDATPSDAGFNENEWIFLAFTWDDTKHNYTVWKNAQVWFSVTNAGGSIADTSTILMGAGDTGGTVEALDGDMDQAIFFNYVLQSADLSYLYNLSSSMYAEEDMPVPLTTAINVFLDLYPNNTNFNSKPRLLGFNSSANITNGNFTNATLYVWNDSIVYVKNFSAIAGSPNVSAKNLTALISIDGNFKWNYEYCGVNISLDHICQFDTSNNSFIIDTVAPSLNITAPLYTNILQRASNVLFNFTITEATSTTDDCWFNIDAGTNKSLYSACHSTTILSSNYPYNVSYNGRHLLTFWGNDTLNNVRNTSVSWFVYNYSHFGNKTTVAEGGQVKFNFTLDGAGINTEYAYNNATLNFNGIAYVPDTIDRTNANYTLFEKTVTVPMGAGNSTGRNLSYNWTYDFRNATTSLKTGITDTKYLNAYNVTLSDCSLALGRVILNMSLKDEELVTYVNVTPPEIAIMEIDLKLTSLFNSSQTWLFSKKWTNNETASVCVPYGVLNSSTFKIDFTVGFEASNKVREFYYMDNGTLDNTNNFNSYTDNTIDLLDLTSADSTTFLFTFTDENKLQVGDAIIHTYRDYIGEGIFREVERSKQDNNGETHVHLVEEDVIYYFMVTQNGTIIYTSSTYNAKCLSTPCEISLSASLSDLNWSEIEDEGGHYAISTDKDTRIVTLTFSLDKSSLVNMSIFSYNGTNVTFVNGTSLTAITGSMNLKVPLAYGNKTFFVAIYRDGVFIKSEWIDLTDRARDYFGTTGAILGGLIILSMMLMAITEGAGFIVFTVFAILLVSVMKLVDLNWLAIISLVCAGGIIVWKLVGRRNKTG